MTFGQTIAETLRGLLRSDERVFLMGEDIGMYGGAFRITRGFTDEFGPQRILETPISEGSVVGAAIGAALRGMRPIVEIMFMDFITLGIDQILNHGAKYPGMFGDQARIPVIIRTPAGGGRGYGPTHSQALESLLLTIPGIQIAVPATAQDACGLLKGAAQAETLTIFVEGKTLYGRPGEVDLECAPLPPGQASIIREGRDVTLTAYGRLVPEALAAAEALASEGLHCEIVDLRTLKPLDMETVSRSVEKTGKLVTIEESPLTGGIGGEIAARAFEKCFFAMDAPIRRVAAQDSPVPASLPLEKKHLPDAQKIADAVISICDI